MLRFSSAHRAGLLGCVWTCSLVIFTVGLIENKCRQLVRHFGHYMDAIFTAATGEHMHHTCYCVLLFLDSKNKYSTYI